jgi:hypothetical protein
MMIRLSTYHHSIKIKELVSLVLALLLFHSIKAQDLTNSTNLYIPAGLEFHLDGDFANSGFIQNQGSFFVSGNWRNTNVYQGLGTVTLNGTREQDFSNNENAVFHLVIDGTGTKHIVNKLPITNKLSLFSGIVRITEVDTILLSTTATVAGGSFTSYIDGAFTNEGTGFKFFPIGKNGSYFPVEMLNVTGINPVISLEVFENPPPIQGPPAIGVYSRVYWQRKNIKGTFTGSPIVTGYPVPEDYTNRHVIELLQSESFNQPFTTMGNVTVSFGEELAKIVSGTNLTGNIFLIGTGIPAGGIPGEFYLSTSLSPRAVNTDNQFVKIFGNKLVNENFHLMVYNRWGLLVYETTSLESMIQTGWDGRRNGDGELLPSGGYPYVLRAVTKDGEEVEKKGMISIVN